MQFIHQSIIIVLYSVQKSKKENQTNHYLLHILVVFPLHQAVFSRCRHFYVSVSSEKINSLMRELPAGKYVRLLLPRANDFYLQTYG